MSGEPDLAAAIAEVQVALIGPLLRLRAGTLRILLPRALPSIVPLGFLVLGLLVLRTYLGFPLVPPDLHQPVWRRTPPLLRALNIAWTFVQGFPLLLCPPLREPVVLGLQACGPKRFWKGGGALPFPLLLWACGLLSTWCFAAPSCLSLLDSALTHPSVGPSALWSIPMQPAILWIPSLRPVCIATPPASPCPICISDAAACRSPLRRWVVDNHVCSLGPGSSSGEPRQVLLLPLLSRDGGFLCALPADLHAEVLAESETPLPSAILGPAHLATVPAIEEDEAGEEIPAGLDIPVMLLDLEVSALASMRTFDPVTETGAVRSFVIDAPHLVPLQDRPCPRWLVILWPSRMGRQRWQDLRRFLPSSHASRLQEVEPIAALPRQTIQLEHETPSFLAPVFGGLDYVCPSVLEGNRPHHNPSFGESGDRLPGAFVPAGGRVSPRFPRKFKDPPVPK